MLAGKKKFFPRNVHLQSGGQEGSLLLGGWDDSLTASDFAAVSMPLREDFDFDLVVVVPRLCFLVRGAILQCNFRSVLLLTAAAVHYFLFFFFS